MELGHRFETLRHVATECTATGGKGALVHTATVQATQLPKCRAVAARRGGHEACAGDGDNGDGRVGKGDRRGVG